MEYIFECSGLAKRFRNGTAALDSISLALERGKIYGLVGEERAGKTTLMRIMAGLTDATDGSFSLFGESGKAELEAVRRKVGFLIEKASYLPMMNALQNLKAVAGIKAAADTDCNVLLDAVGLADEKRTMMFKFSESAALRYGVAAALVGDPELLVLDEPMRGLDLQGKRGFREMLARIVEERGCTVLISSGSPAELYTLATDYIFIHRGKMAAAVTAEELADSCNKEIVLRTSNNDAAMRTLSKLTDSITLEEDGIHIRSAELSSDEVVHRMKSNTITVHSLEENGMNFAEYFAKITGGAANA